MTTPRHQFTYLGKPRTLYKRRPDREAFWHFSFEWDRRKYTACLFTHLLDGPSGAVALAKQAIDSAMRGKWLEFRGLTSNRTAPTGSGTTLAEVVAAFRQLPKPLPHYEQCARLFLARAGTRPGKDWQTTPLDLLTADLVAEFRAAVHAAAEAEEDEETAESLQRTAQTYLRGFRAMFSPRRREEYRRRFKLTLPPSLDGFLTAPGPEAPSKLYVIPDDAIIARTFHALQSLAETDPNAHTAIWLALGCGMRKSEIAACAVDWFITIAGARHVRLKMRTKNGTRDVDIKLTNGAETFLDDAIRRAAARHAQAPERPPYLLEGSDTERTEETFRRVSTWMAALGWSSQKRIHEFRAFGGSQVAMRDGLLAARDWCRHSSQATTEKHYGRYVKTHISVAPITLHEQPANILPLPTPAPSAASAPLQVLPAE